MYGFLDGSANLTCRADAKPTPFFTWLRDGQPIERQDNFETISTDNMSLLRVSWQRTAGEMAAYCR